ncbi:MAG TPA: TolC family protein, partial [Casimicrobiaceae bacterium]|nr:TolC family protein [Casimicrobiaceae bacterium]
MNRLSLAVAASLAVSILHCAPVCADDLMQIYQEAERNDPALAAARANFEATKEAVPQARSALLPNVSLTGALNANNYDASIHSDPRVDIKRDFWFGGLTVSVAQPLYRYANTVALSVAKKEVEQSDYSLAAAQQDLILRVA